MKKPYYVKRNTKVTAVAGRVLLRTLLFLIALITITLVVGWSIFSKRYLPTIEKWYWESWDVAESSDFTDFQAAQTGYIYASDGSELLKLKQDKEVKYVKYDDLPESVLNAFVSIEDKRFYQHHGVDWASTMKAVYNIATTGESSRGGSTITQQLARNVYLTFEQSYERKIREIFLAINLEKKYSKTEILEFYINSINFGNGYYGIGAAAKGYFDKEVSELTLDEVAFLCAIPNNPSYYNPITNYEHTITRRNIILKEMYEQGHLSQKDYLASCNSSSKVIEIEEEYDDYAASYALYCAVKIIMRDVDGFQFRTVFKNESDYEQYKKQYSEAYSAAKSELYSGGYRVYTSLNVNTQQELQKEFNDVLSDFKETTEDGNYLVQGAATVIDNNTGYVIAVIGGRNNSNSKSLGFNRAFQGYQQPGSCIKPIAVYTPAIDLLDYTANTPVDDSPIEDGPENSGGVYSGHIDLRTAVEKSRNVVAWKVFEELGPQNGLMYLQNMGFARIVPTDYVLSAGIGGLTYGVSTVEMASAYSALENFGVWRDPTCVIKIENSEGKTINAERTTKIVYSHYAAANMTDILKGVLIRGTAAGLDLEGGHEAAGKTGTTNDNKVAWFCGYTHYYSVACYVGADNPVTIPGLVGGTYPAKIWQRLQNVLLRNCAPQPLIDDKDLQKSNKETVELSENGVEDDYPKPEVQDRVENTAVDKNDNMNKNEDSVVIDNTPTQSAESTIEQIPQGQPHEQQPQKPQEKPPVETGVEDEEVNNYEEESSETEEDEPLINEDSQEDSSDTTESEVEEQQNLSVE